MSSEMIKVIGMAEMAKPTQPSVLGRTQDVRGADKGKDVAAVGNSLPQDGGLRQEAETDKPYQVERVVSQMNEFVQTLNRDLQFTIDQDSGQTIIKVLDSETKEVIRQIPREELLEIANHLNEGAGVLLKVRA